MIAVHSSPQFVRLMQLPCAKKRPINTPIGKLNTIYLQDQLGVMSCPISILIQSSCICLWVGFLYCKLRGYGFMPHGPFPPCLRTPDEVNLLDRRRSFIACITAFGYLILIDQITTIISRLQDSFMWWSRLAASDKQYVNN